MTRAPCTLCGDVVAPYGEAGAERCSSHFDWTDRDRIALLQIGSIDRYVAGEELTAAEVWARSFRWPTPDQNRALLAKGWIRGPVPEGGYAITDEGQRALDAMLRSGTGGAS